MTDHSSTEPSQVKNTDRELWREKKGDYYSPSIHVTENGAIGIDVGGLVFVRSLREWHNKACEYTDLEKQNATLREALSNLVKKLQEIDANESYQGVWCMAYAHDYIYTGPSYTTEINAAIEILAKIPPLQTSSVPRTLAADTSENSLAKDSTEREATPREDDITL